MRSRRSGPGVPISFFSLQDIIISVTGVLIVILLLLALDLDVSLRTAQTESKTRDALRSRLGALKEQLERAHLLAGEATDAGVFAPADRAPALLEELRDLEERMAVRKELLASMEGSGELRLIREQLVETEKHAKAENEAADTAEAATKATDEKVQEATTSLKSIEAQLLQLQQERNHLWLIPESSGTTLEPLLAIVSKDEIKVSRFDRPEDDRTGPTDDLRRSIGKLLKGFSPESQYVVFLFRPSGIGHFDETTSETKRLGFEIGYDATEEDFTLKFAPASEDGS